MDYTQEYMVTVDLVWLLRLLKVISFDDAYVIAETMADKISRVSQR